ncbi:MAG: phosphate uptake regulator PhoU, partial [Promethearchaeota archaeon]
IKHAIEAFDQESVRFVENFNERDDEVDDLRWSIFRECIIIMMENPNSITSCAHYMMIARYLERCADHACKIAEKTYYMVTGEHREFS